MTKYLSNHKDFIVTASDGDILCLRKCLIRQFELTKILYVRIYLFVIVMKQLNE